MVARRQCEPQITYFTSYSVIKSRKKSVDPQILCFEHMFTRICFFFSQERYPQSFSSPSLVWQVCLSASLAIDTSNVVSSLPLLYVICIIVLS